MQQWPPERTQPTNESRQAHSQRSLYLSLYYSEDARETLGNFCGGWVFYACVGLIWGYVVFVAPPLRYPAGILIYNELRSAYGQFAVLFLAIRREMLKRQSFHDNNSRMAFVLIQKQRICFDNLILNEQHNQNVAITTIITMKPRW